MSRTMLRGLAAATGLLLCGALLGALWAPLDSLAIVQPYLAGMLVLLCLAPLGLAWRAGALTLVAVAVWDVVALLPAGGPAEAGPVRMVQHNLHLGNRAADLPRRLDGADIATLQEVGEAMVTLRALQPEWRLRICPRPGWVSTVAMTRLEVVGSGCTASGGAWIRARLPGCFGPEAEVTIVSAHLFWPWPHEGDRQAEQVAGLVSEISGLPRPILLGGDLNQMPWSAAADRLARAVGGSVAGGLHATYVKKDGWVRLPIDHVVADDALAVSTWRGGRGRSDHHALLAEVAPAAGAGSCAAG